MVSKIALSVSKSLKVVPPRKVEWLDTCDQGSVNQMKSRRSWRFFTVALLANNVAILSWFALVEATACAKICYTTELAGFGPGGTAGCSCSGSGAGARTGEGDCNCGQCYAQSTDVVYGFAVNPDGTCTYGTDCGSCDYSSSLSANTSSNPVTPSSGPAPSPTPTPSPSPTPSLAPATLQYSFAPEVTLSPPKATSSSIVDVSSTPDSASIDRSSSSSSSDKSGETTGSLADRNASDNGFSAWQIILAVCCSVLVVVVAVVWVCSCYCKKRSRSNEPEEAQIDYYSQQLPHVFQSNRLTLTAATCVKSPACV